MAADHDLLFGLLALQVGLVDQGQLVAAFQAWTRDRSRSLAEHLVDRDDLDADDWSAIDALVSRYLKRHGGDPETSLAGFTPGLTLLASLEALGDGDLSRTIATLDPGSDPGADPNRTSYWPVAGPGAGPSRFRVLRLHASGGLGKVFVALDTELNREVALKRIRDRLADDPASRSRFVVEAEITGRLEHPNIAPVYSLGADADGRPYYAMRLIRGESLRKAIDRFHAGDGSAWTAPPLELRKLLRRFLDACNAVEYAHSRGVIHRDLKPGNIVLGRHGETLVVDWGLAKYVGLGGQDDVGESSECSLRPGGQDVLHETVAGSTLGTPAYMSPEQAEGRVADVGIPSDVYSLGATLYCLLAGRPPLGESRGEGEAEVSEILKRVRVGRFPPPREANSGVPPALEAVALKAMALRPEDRYPSARALAEEIEHWLADEPVSSWREPLSARAGRWWRRHPRLGSAALSTAAVVVVALSASTILLRDISRREARAHAQAERNLDVAIRSVDELLSRFTDDPRLQARGLETLRREYLLRARDLFSEMTSTSRHQDSPGLQAERGRTYLRIARINLALDQFPEAQEAADLAAGVFRRLGGESPGDPPFEAELARAVECSALAALGQRRHEEALDGYRRACSIWASVAGHHPDVPDYRLGHSNCLTTLGMLLRSHDELAAAEVRLQEALRLCDGEDTGSLAARAGALRGIGMVLEARAVGLPRGSAEFSSLLEEAQAALEESLDLHVRLIEREPDAPKWQSRMIDTFLSFATSHCNGRRPGPAIDRLARVRPVAEALVEEHPDVPDYRGLLAACDVIDAWCLALLGSHAEAARTVDLAVSRAPEDGPTLYLGAIGLAQAAEAASARGADGEAYLDRAVEHLERAHSLGMFRYALAAKGLREGEDFRALRLRGDFRALLARLETSPQRP